jgi:hypothetical protein
MCIHILFADEQLHLTYSHTSDQSNLIDRRALDLWHH